MGVRIYNHCEQSYLNCFLSLAKKIVSSLREFLEKKGFVRVPLKKLITGHYLFDAKINDSSGKFILDTGASASCVGFDESGHFSLVGEESLVKAAGAGATNMDTMLSRNNTFFIREKAFKKMDFVLFDLSHVNEALRQANEGPVHGIIGADFLKWHRAVIDYGRNCFYVKV